MGAYVWHPFHVNNDRAACHTQYLPHRARERYVYNNHAAVVIESNYPQDEFEVK